MGENWEENCMWYALRVLGVIDDVRTDIYNEEEWRHYFRDPPHPDYMFDDIFDADRVGFRLPPTVRQLEAAYETLHGGFGAGRRIWMSKGHAWAEIDGEHIDELGVGQRLGARRVRAVWEVTRL